MRTSSSSASFWQKFCPLFAIGLLGVVSLAPVLLSVLPKQLAQLQQPVPVSISVLVVLALLQTSLLLAVSIALGAAVTAQLGLRSHFVQSIIEQRPFWPLLRAHLATSVLLGVAGFAIVAALDISFRPLLGQSWQRLSQSGVSGTPASVIAGVLYGGITEELMLRWGLMSLTAWCGWRILQKGNAEPRASLMWTAIILSALLFGAGHLPATAAIVPLTPIIVVRALVLNGVIGCIAGWLFWRRGLESAMVAHAMFHITSAVAALWL
jgi:hypothetical protein